MRMALGCMRLSTEVAAIGEEAALAVLRAALDAGITTFDTAHAYAPVLSGGGREGGANDDADASDGDLGHNERLLARAFRERGGRPAGARVVTKCGMRRDGGAWVPDGRASAIAADAAASVEALGGAPPDLLLLHAPDPAVALATSARALARAREDGLARAVGLSNVSRKQLEEAAAHAPVAAVEVALGAYDDVAIRGGVVAYCLERGIEVLAHAPLGGPARARRLARDRKLGDVAAARGAAPLDVFLAYLLAVKPELVPVVGARRPDTVAHLAAAEALLLDDAELAALDARFPGLAYLRGPPAARASSSPSPSSSPTRPAADVVLIAGIAGAGKSRHAQRFVAGGYERLNRDTLGGTLSGIARRLDERLGAGAARVVLDNTYVTRAARHDVLRVVARHGARARCLFLDTPLPDAQVNAVLRMLDRFGHVLDPEELDRLGRRDPVALAPRVLYRMVRELEPPAPDEGFAEIEVVPFARERAAGPDAGGGAGASRAARGAVLVSLAADEPGSSGAAAAIAIARQVRAAALGGPCLLYAWRPAAAPAERERLDALAAAVAAELADGRLVEAALCPHPAGPPICWCRPPLPALPLAFAHRHGLDPASLTLVGASPADRALARALGATLVEPLAGPS